jgi:multiple sugar transport system permease protein
MAYAVYISFTDWRIGSVSFIGLKNYTRMATDRYFWQSLGVTFKYTAGAVPSSLVLGFLLALLLNQKIRALAFFRTLYYLPSVISGVAVAVLWSWLFNSQFGLINYILTKVGLPPIGWLTNPKVAIWSLVIVQLWKVGSTMVIYLAGLQGIPTELYEAASIDGANALSRLLHVTIPLMTPVILFNLVMAIISSFQAFVNAYVLTYGGPLRSTMLYMLYLYETAWGASYVTGGTMNIGYAAALAWVLFFIILAFTLLVLRSSPMWVYYESLEGEKR